VVLLVTLDVSNHNWIPRSSIADYNSKSIVRLEDRRADDRERAIH
jgi:hypothetical protein